MTLEKKVQAHRAAARVRQGSSQPEVVPLRDDILVMKPNDLNELAWPLVRPERTIYGREGEGLALAREAWAQAKPGDRRAAIADTLAWALFAVGLDDEALASSGAAVELAAPAEREKYADQLVELEAAVEEARQASTLSHIEAEWEQLDREVSARRVWHFKKGSDAWRHGQLKNLVHEIEAFADAETGPFHGTSVQWGWGIERRLDLAREMEAHTTSAPDFAAAWSRASAAIAADARYGYLQLDPQLGLLPIGQDPHSGLWEFAHVLTGEVPTRDTGGFLEIDEDTCLVLVLIPGGSFHMGAQPDDPDAPNHDPGAETDESPVRPLELAPFFLSKFEMTQAQWLRCTGGNPSLYPAGETHEDEEITGLHPVERVSWSECSTLVYRLGLTLPTEAQWEYAARAGTTTPWLTGDAPENLIGYANLEWRIVGDWIDFDDEFVIHGPVGSLPPNSFGLHEIHGNVREWCQDVFGGYHLPVQPRTGERISEDSQSRAARGGTYMEGAAHARLSYRYPQTPDFRFQQLGLRPARAIHGSP